MPFWSSKKSEGKQVRLFFATDVHGSEPTFRKFINAGKFYNVNYLVLGGDITGKLLVPILAQGGDSYKATLQRNLITIQGKQELADFQKRLAKLGFYDCIVSEQEYRQLTAEPKKVEEIYRDKARQRLTSWIQLAEERLAVTDIRCYITGGNDDPPEVLDVLKEEARERVVPCEGALINLGDDGHSMVSLGYSNPTPWKTPREISEEQLEVEIIEVVKGIADFRRVVFNFHAPPVDSTLDTCPMLDDSTDPPTVITSGGEPVLYGAGSKAVRQAIEKCQPLLSLHGHIHESRGVIQIGRTTAANPGSEYGEAILRGVLTTLSGEKVASIQLTSG
jgi:Icc-related predicted phosphoesterase